MIEYKKVIYKDKVFYWVHLRHEDWRYLYYDEWLTDTTISKMFDVSIYAVKQARRGYGFSRKNFKIEQTNRVRELMRSDYDPSKRYDY